jgi:hypothetical protein
LALGAVISAVATWILEWPYPYGIAYCCGTLTGIGFWRFHEYRARYIQAESAIDFQPTQLQAHIRSVSREKDEKVG